MRKNITRLIRIISLFIVISVFSSTVSAQSLGSEQNNLATETAIDSVPRARQVDAKNELSIWGGIAPEGANVLVRLRDSTFGQIAVRYSRRLAASENVALKYTVDFVPLSFISYDRERVIQTPPTTTTVQREKDTVYGVGVTPVGFQVNFLRQKKVQPFVMANAGLIVFTRPIPDDRGPVFPSSVGTRLNFVTGGGGGLEFQTETDRSVNVGVKLQHISNAGRGTINPGFNQTLFFVGYTFKKW